MGEKQFVLPSRDELVRRLRTVSGNSCYEEFFDYFATTRAGSCKTYRELEDSFRAAIYFFEADMPDSSVRFLTQKKRAFVEAMLEGLA